MVLLGLYNPIWIILPGYNHIEPAAVHPAGQYPPYGPATLTAHWLSHTAPCGPSHAGHIGLPCSPDASLPAQAFATIIPRVSQVDNSSDFLGNVPHRRHPGVLHLRSVRLPAELVKAAQLLVERK